MPPRWNGIVGTTRMHVYIIGMGERVILTMQNRLSETVQMHMALLTFALILALWIGTWILKIALDAAWPVLAGEAASFTYWTTAKLLAWILPSICLVRRTGRTVRGLFTVHSLRKMLLWSGLIGVVLVLMNIGGHWLKHTPVFAHVLSFSFVNVVVIAPVFEEFTMRGAIFGELRRRYSFPVANTVTALLFVLLHCPGWYFKGSLVSNLLTPLGGALSIFVIGWLCGLVAERGRSVIGSMLVHLLNNLTV